MDNPAFFSDQLPRAVLLTEAMRQGAIPSKLKEHSLHKTVEVISEYVRDHEGFRDRAGDTFL